jgi:hypothetical protein
VRLRLDVLLVFSANPEDYTARGKIVTPLKDRIGSEIRTHYPATRHHAMAITAQEAWLERRGPARVEVPDFVREVVEEVAFQARQDSKIDKRSGVSQRLPISLLENVVSNAERRALLADERIVCRGSPTSTRPCRRSPASSSSSTRGSCAAPTTWRATSSAPRSATSSAATLRRRICGRSPSGSTLGGTLQIDDTLSAKECWRARCRSRG